MSTDLIPRPTLISLVQAHDQAQALVADGMAKLAQAKKAMDEIFPQTWHGLFPDRLTDYHLDKDAEKIATHVREQFWRYTMAQTGIRDRMSSSDRERMDKMFEKHETPEFSMGNLASTLQGLAENATSIFHAAIRETFDRLRPRGTLSTAGYKTNKRDRVGQKVIMGHMVGPFGLSHYSRDLLVDLDKAFHGLDGKGFPQYPGDAVTVIEQALRNRTYEAETPYFRMRAHPVVGSLHVWFKRLDLLSEFNRIGSGGRAVVGQGEAK